MVCGFISSMYARLVRRRYRSSSPTVGQARWWSGEPVSLFQHSAGVKAQVRCTRHQRIVGKSGVFSQVRDNGYSRLENEAEADRAVERRLL